MASRLIHWSSGEGASFPPHPPSSSRDSLFLYLQSTFLCFILTIFCLASSLKGLVRDISDVCSFSYSFQITAQKGKSPFSDTEAILFLTTRGHPHSALLFLMVNWGERSPWLIAYKVIPVEVFSNFCFWLLHRLLYPDFVLSTCMFQISSLR